MVFSVDFPWQKLPSSRIYHYFDLGSYFRSMVSCPLTRCLVKYDFSSPLPMRYEKGYFTQTFQYISLDWQ